jgi:heat shock protein HtpX
MSLVKTFLLLAMLSGTLITIGYLIIGGTAGIIIGIILAAISSFSAWYASDKLILKYYQARLVNIKQNPELYRSLERLSQRAQIPTPAFYIVEIPGANAFATGRDPAHAAVALTEGIIKLLPQQELEAVIAHEISHIKNYDTLIMTVASTIYGASFWLLDLAWRWIQLTVIGSRTQNSHDKNFSNKTNFVVLLLITFLAHISAFLIKMSISRTREYEADAGAARLTGNPRAVANALQMLKMQSSQKTSTWKNLAFEHLFIVNSYLKTHVSELLSTHPPIEKRIDNLLKKNKVNFSRVDRIRAIIIFLLLLGIVSATLTLLIPFISHGKPAIFPDLFNYWLNYWQEDLTLWLFWVLPLLEVFKIAILLFLKTYFRQERKWFISKIKFILKFNLNLIFGLLLLPFIPRKKKQKGIELPLPPMSLPSLPFPLPHLNLILMLYLFISFASFSLIWKEEHKK